MRLLPDHFPLSRVALVDAEWTCEGCKAHKQRGTLMALVRDLERLDPTDVTTGGLYSFCLPCCQRTASENFAEYLRKSGRLGPWVVRWVDTDPEDSHDAYLLESGSWNGQREKARLFDSYEEADAALAAVREQFAQFDDYDPSTHFVESTVGAVPA